MKTQLSLMMALLMLLGCAVCFSSCGNDQTLTFGKELLQVSSQLDALNGLLKGDADIAVIDSVMAGYYMNETDEFADYQILSGTILAEEKYGIGAKKGNNALIGKINEALIALANNDAKTIAAQYGLTDDLLVTSSTQNPYADATDDSWNNLIGKKNPKLIIGYTLFAPIAYYDGDGQDASLIGFDVDLAKAVVKYLNSTYQCNIEIEFLKIEWNDKEELLANGSIDLVWNGMTITTERIEGMALSVPYLANNQVAVVKKSEAEKYGTGKDALIQAATDAIIIVEKGSAGEEVVCPVQ